MCAVRRQPAGGGAARTPWRSHGEAVLPAGQNGLAAAEGARGVWRIALPKATVSDRYPER